MQKMRRRWFPHARISVSRPVVDKRCKPSNHHHWLLREAEGKAWPQPAFRRVRPPTGSGAQARAPRSRPGNFLKLLALWLSRVRMNRAGGAVAS